MDRKQRDIISQMSPVTLAPISNFKCGIWMTEITVC